MTKRITLIPAYGRDYKSKKAVEADFNADKDFIICDMSNPYDGKPVNRSQLKAGGGTRATFGTQGKLRCT